MVLTSPSRLSVRRVVAALSVWACSASAQEFRYDHRGALGLTVATGGEWVSQVGLESQRDLGGRLPIELGATVGFWESTEARVAVRLAPAVIDSTGLAWSAYAGVRNSFGREHWKTFFDLDFAAHWKPGLAFGARGAFGVQYDFLPVVGAYAQLGAQLGGATSLRLSFELMLGLQFRTYVLE